MYVALYVPINTCMEAHLYISCAVHVRVQHLIFHACLKLPKETTSLIHNALFVTVPLEHTGYPNAGFFCERLIKIKEHYSVNLSNVLKSQFSNLLYTCNSSRFFIPSDKSQVRLSRLFVLISVTYLCSPWRDCYGIKIIGRVSFNNLTCAKKLPVCSTFWIYCRQRNNEVLCWFITSLNLRETKWMTANYAFTIRRADTEV